MSLQIEFLVVLTLFASACSDGRDRRMEPDATVPCSSPEDCDDGRWCNGSESCVMGTCWLGPAPCDEGTSCDEETLACGASCSAPDRDGDGELTSNCGGADCDDGDWSVGPHALEVCDASGRDEDCDASTFGYVDADGDGFVSSSCCNARDGESACGPDCDDASAAVHPDVEEVCDGVDNDCTGTVDDGAMVLVFRPDHDGDGFGAGSESVLGCPGPEGWVTEGGDCDDTSAEVRPGAPELCNGIDDDCDGSDLAREADADGDGHVPSTTCSGGPLAPGDCDDTSSAVRPLGAEVCDGLDNDCDGTVDGPDASVSCDEIAGFVVSCSDAACVRSGCAGAAGCDEAVGTSLGLYDSCVVRASGRLSCFGSTPAPFADGLRMSRPAPVDAVDVTNAVGVAIGWAWTCVLRATGVVSCVGYNRDGQLGDGTTIDRNRWVDVVGLGDAIDVDAGRDWHGGSGAHTCAARAGGTIACWGSNADGQLGNGTLVNSATPVAASGISTAVDVEVGCGNTCALLGDGTVECWGGAWSYVVGMGRRTTPVVIAGIASATQISLNGLHACARLADGTVSCWGANVHGQLGDGGYVSRSVPRAVSGLTAVVSVSAADDFTCAVRESGTVSCWGRNPSGQLGDGTLVGRALPADVVRIDDALDVATGKSHACAIRPGGSLWCWGHDGSGELGNGSPLEDALVPVVAWLHEP